LLTGGCVAIALIRVPRTARVAPGGLVYHVLNRALARLPLFRKEADDAAFERVLLEAYERTPTREPEKVSGTNIVLRGTKH
jgi:hypothetical protein